MHWQAQISRTPSSGRCGALDRPHSLLSQRSTALFRKDERMLDGLLRARGLVILPSAGQAYRYDDLP